MTELIELLPQVFIYLIIGYSYVNTYRFVRVVENNQPFNHSLMNYIICGYIFKMMSRYIPISISGITEYIVMILISIICGYSIAKFVNSALFTKVRMALKVYQTPNKYIWSDISDKKHGVAIAVTNAEDVTYIGALMDKETYQRQPLIRLVKYQVLVGGKLIEDYSKDPTKVILIDTSKYEAIRIMYHKDSDNIQRWKEKPQRQGIPLPPLKTSVSKADAIINKRNREMIKK